MILALKTADHTTSAWLFAAAGTTTPHHELHWESGRQLSDQLLEHLSQFLAGQSKSFTDLTGIIIFSGPGSFTSLRIGHTVVNALADSLGIPVVGTKGEDWLIEARRAVKTAQPGQPALPHYGAEAHITNPKT